MNIYVVFALMRAVQGYTDRIWDLQCNTSENVIQAIGTNFSVTVVSACGDGDYGCEISYRFVGNGYYDGTKINVGEHEANVTRNHMAYGVEIFYVYTIKNRKSVFFDLTIASGVKPITVDLLYFGQRNCYGGATRFASIHFKGCQNQTQIVIGLHSTSVARYMDIGKIICQDNANGRAIFSNGSEALQTQCLADATWRGLDDITCLYPIPVQLQIDNRRYSQTMAVKYNDSTSDLLPLRCSASAIRDDRNYSKRFILQDKMLDPPEIEIHPRLNGARLSCYIENNFTNYFNQSTETYLSTTTLNVSFGPYPPEGYSSICSFQNGSISFYSNPSATMSSLTLFTGDARFEIPVELIRCCGMRYGAAGQMIIIPEYVVKDIKLILRSNNTGKYDYFHVMPCDGATTNATDFSVSSISPYSTGHTSIDDEAMSHDVILLTSLSAVAVLLLIILTGCLVWERRIKRSN